MPVPTTPSPSQKVTLKPSGKPDMSSRWSPGGPPSSPEPPSPSPPSPDSRNNPGWNSKPSWNSGPSWNSKPSWNAGPSWGAKAGSKPSPWGGGSSWGGDKPWGQPDGGNWKPDGWGKNVTPRPSRSPTIRPTDPTRSPTVSIFMCFQSFISSVNFFESHFQYLNVPFFDLSPIQLTATTDSSTGTSNASAYASSN